MTAGRPLEVLAVCSGNICRSPLLEKLLARALAGTARVRSAGTLGLSGYPPYHVCAALAPEFGVDLDDFQSTPLDEELLSTADFVLVLEKRHRSHIQSIYGEHPGLFLVSEFLPPSYQRQLRFTGHDAATIRQGSTIPDPMGRPSAEVRPVLEILELAAQGFVAWLEERRRTQLPVV